MGQRTIDTIIRLTGENEYRAALKNCASEQKLLKAELDSVTSEYRNNANSMEALTAKGEVLAKMQDLQNQKVETLNKALADSKNKYESVQADVEAQAEAYADAKAALASFGDEVDKTSDAYVTAKKKADDLHDSYSKQLAKQDALNSEVEKYQTQVYRAEIELNKLDDAVAENNRLLDEAKSSADGCATSIDQYGKAVSDAAEEIKDAGDSSNFGDFLKADLITEGASQIIESMKEIVEETREYRKIMASLNESSQQAGYTANETSEAYTRLFGVLADEQSAATTTANLQALQLPQEQLLELINGTIGAWSTYGDSIPIDGLAEAINHTAKLGEVQGTFADVLEWSGITVDDFNNSLAQCGSVEERVQLIMNELTRQNLPALGEAWQENNASLVEANEANANLQAQMARLGETIEPIFTALTNGAAWLLGGLNDLIDVVKSAPAAFDPMAIAAANASGDFSSLAEQTMNLQDEVADAAEELEDYTDIVEDAGDAHSEMDKDLQATADQLKAAKQIYSDVKTAARDSIETQIGLFDDLSGKSEMSTQDMIKNLKSQREAFENYADNITLAMERGIDIGLVQQLSDGSVESMQILAELVTATAEEIDELNQAFLGTQDAKDYVAKGMAAVSQEYLDAMQSVKADLNAEAKAAGKAVGDGLISGVKSKQAEYKSALYDTGLIGQNAYKEANYINSPSRRYQELARNDVDGLIVEYKASKPRLQEASRELADTGYSSMIRAKQAAIPSLSSTLSTATTPQGDAYSGLLQQILVELKAGSVITLDKSTLVGHTVADYDQALGQRQLLTDRGAI